MDYVWELIAPYVAAVCETKARVRFIKNHTRAA